MSDAPGLRVHRHSGGDGSPVVVLLHAGVADARGWDAVALRLANAGCRVLAPDLRGYGASPDPTGDFRHADDVLAVLDDEGVTERVALVGWSMSGTPALELALDHPERVASVALVCSVPGGLPRSQFVQDSWAREEALFEAGDVDGAIANDVATWGVGIGRELDALDPAIAEYIAAIDRDLLAREERAGGEAHLGEAQDGDRDSIARLGELRAPLLVVTADHDTPCHEDAAQALTSAVPGARHVQLRGAAHMAPMELPDEVANLLLAHARRD